MTVYIKRMDTAEYLSQENQSFFGLNSRVQFTSNVKEARPFDTKREAREYVNMTIDLYFDLKDYADELCFEEGEYIWEANSSEDY